jgi:hypothetical protein
MGASSLHDELLGVRKFGLSKIAGLRVLEEGEPLLCLSNAESERAVVPGPG